MPLRYPLLLSTALSPARSNKLVELFTHHRFYHDPNGALGQRTQVLMEDLLVWFLAYRKQDWIC